MLGKLLEEKAKFNTSSAIKKLIGLQPKTVLRVTDTSETETAIEDVQVGDKLLVRPADKIPVGWWFIMAIHLSMRVAISGEPVAVEQCAGDKVVCRYL